ncbi:hypothetical protein pb186bvf_011497 [Paramecium bursaria]
MIKSKRFLDKSQLVENQYIIEYIIMVLKLNNSQIQYRYDISLRSVELSIIYFMQSLTRFSYESSELEQAIILTIFFTLQKIQEDIPEQFKQLIIHQKNQYLMEKISQFIRSTRNYSTLSDFLCSRYKDIILFVQLETQFYYVSKKLLSKAIEEVFQQNIKSKLAQRLQQSLVDAAQI